MKLLAAFAFTVLVADVIYLVTGNWLLVAATGLIGGYSWAHAQRGG